MVSGHCDLDASSITGDAGAALVNLTELGVSDDLVDDSLDVDANFDMTSSLDMDPNFDLLTGSIDAGNYFSNGGFKMGFLLAVLPTVLTFSGLHSSDW